MTICLAAWAADGDVDAFRVLLERHYDTIFRVDWRFCGTREDAEDVAQDVCVGLVGKLRSFKGKARFSTWLYRVVMNAARDHRRKRRNAARTEKDYEEVTELRRAGAADTNRQVAWVHRSLEQLGEDLSETALLVLGEEVKHADAGEILGVSESTVSWRMHEVRKQLKALAKEEA